MTNSRLLGVIYSCIPALFSTSISVAVDGDTIVIGVLTNRDNGAFAGSAYLFTHSAGVWNETIKLLASDSQLGNFF